MSASGKITKTRRALCGSRTWVCGARVCTATLATKPTRFRDTKRFAQVLIYRDKLGAHRKNGTRRRRCDSDVDADDAPVGLELGEGLLEMLRGAGKPLASTAWTGETSCSRASWSLRGSPVSFVGRIPCCEKQTRGRC